MSTETGILAGIEARYVRYEAAHDRLPTLHEPRHALAPIGQGFLAPLLGSVLS